MESKDVIKISFSPQFPPTGFPVIGSGWEGRLNGHKTTTIRQKKKNYMKVLKGCIEMQNHQTNEK